MKVKKIDKDNIYTYITKLTLIKIIVYLVLNLEIWFSIIFSFSGLVCVQCFWAMFLVNARKCCTIFFLTQFHPHLILLRPTRDDCRSIYSKLLILHIIFSQQSHQVLCIFFRKCQTSNCCVIPFCSSQIYFRICLCQSVGICFIGTFFSFKLFRFFKLSRS